MIKNIIFDWGGTLSDDFLTSYKAALFIFKKYNIKKISLNKYRQEFELPYMKFYTKYIPDLGINDEQRLFLQAIKKIGGINPFPEAKPLLKSIQKRKVEMALLSAHPGKKLEQELDDTGIGEFFVCTKGWVIDKKKAIGPFLKKCKFRTEETCFVGDVVHDIGAGKKMGLKTIAVTWGYATKDMLEAAKPDAIADNFTMLKKIILTM